MRLTPEQGRAYMAAVEAGDVDAAQRMAAGGSPGANASSLNSPDTYPRIPLSHAPMTAA